MGTGCQEARTVSPTAMRGARQSGGQLERRGEILEMSGTGHLRTQQPIPNTAGGEEGTSLGVCPEPILPATRHGLCRSLHACLTKASSVRPYISPARVWLATAGVSEPVRPEVSDRMPESQQGQGGQAAAWLGAESSRSTGPASSPPPGPSLRPPWHFCLAGLGHSSGHGDERLVLGTREGV